MLSAHLLTALLVLPAASALVVWTFPSEGQSGARGLALFAMLAELLLAGYVATQFRLQDGGEQLSEVVAWLPSLGISWALGLDGWTLLLVLLTAALSPLALLASYDEVSGKPRDYAACLLLLEAGLIGNLLARDLFVFYLFWEAMLLPAFFLIGAWGSERSPRAAMRFFLFTMFGSMLLLTGLVYTGQLGVADAAPSLLFADLQANLGQLDLGQAEFGLFVGFALAFLIKVPLWPLHGWLPETYGEAPASALVLISGVMVKLGAIAFFRLALLLFPRAATVCMPTIMALAVVGCLYAAWLAAGQSRLRRVVAYASMSHMSLCVMAMTTMAPLALTGAMVQLVSHGINVAALFLLIGAIERRCGTDYFSDLGSLATDAPHLAGCFVLASLANMGLPGLNGFVGEFLLMCGAWRAQGLGVALSRGSFAQAGIVALLTLGALVALRVVWTLWRLQAPIWRSTSGRALRLAGALATLAGIAGLIALPAGGSQGGLAVRLLAPLATSEAKMTAPNKVATAFALFSVVLCAVYMLRAIERTCFGATARSQSVEDLSLRERLTVWPLLVAMVVFGLWPRPIIALAEPTASAMANYFREGAGWTSAEPPEPPPATVPASRAAPAAPPAGRAVPAAQSAPDAPALVPLSPPPASRPQ